jgi:hypothetical protein
MYKQNKCKKYGLDPIGARVDLTPLVRVDAPQTAITTRDIALSPSPHASWN